MSNCTLVMVFEDVVCAASAKKCIAGARFSSRHIVGSEGKGDNLIVRGLLTSSDIKRALDGFSFTQKTDFDLSGIDGYEQAHCYFPEWELVKAKKAIMAEGTRLKELRKG